MHLVATVQCKQKRRNTKAAIKRAKTRGAKAVARQRCSAFEKEEKRSKERGRTGTIRRFSGTKMNATMPVKDTSGQLLTDPTVQLERWLEHFGSHFQVSATPPTPQHDPPRVRRITPVNTEAPSETAIDSMKSNRVPGVDRISVEMLKAHPVVFAQLLHRLFCNIWKTATFPVDWMHGVLIKVPKKGNLTVCDNWRGIMLL